MSGKPRSVRVTPGKSRRRRLPVGEPPAELVEALLVVDRAEGDAVEGALDELAKTIRKLLRTGRMYAATPGTHAPAPLLEGLPPAAQGLRRDPDAQGRYLPRRPDAEPLYVHASGTIGYRPTLLLALLDASRRES